MIEKYQFIANDILKKSELYNNDLKNYQVIKSIKNLSSSNKEILKNLNYLNQQNSEDMRKNYSSKCKKLIDIYFGYVEHYEKGNNQENNKSSESSSEVEEDPKEEEKKIENKPDNNCANKKEIKVGTKENRSIRSGKKKMKKQK